MRLLPAALLCAAFAASCTTTGYLEVDPAAPPKEQEYKGVTRYEEKEVPGIRYWHKAAIAYADYLNIVHEQEEQENPIAREKGPIVPEELLEEKKRQHLAHTEENLRKLFGLNPDYARAHQLMGLVHFEREEYDEAVAEFQEVLRIDPLAENAWVNIAHSRWRQGDADKAKEAISEALKINPENRPAIGLREVIENKQKAEARKKASEDIPPFRPRLDR